MTIINTNSISGINSITAQGASGVSFYDSSSNFVQSVTGGGVGIGTDNPGAANLAIVDPGTASFSIGQNVDGTGAHHLGIYYGGSSGGPGADVFTSNGDISIWVDGAGPPTSQIRFGRSFGADTWMTMTSAGRIGIGTTSPSNLLHVKNDTTSSNYITAENTTAGNAGVRLKNNQGDYAIFANDDLIFYDLENDAERLHISSAGKLVLPTGSPGIQFGATDNPAASGGIDISSQTLDDYEEGTWTPVIKSGNNTISYTGGTQYFTYIKIGNKVTLSFNLSAATTSGTIGGPFTMEGIPFLAVANSRNLGSLCNFYGSGLRATHWPAFIHIDATNNFDIYYKTASNSNYDRDTVAEVGSNTYMMWTATYFVD